jgi:hypothetical protein
MTTKRLAEKVIQDIQRLSPEEKAKLREYLDKEFNERTKIRPE